MKAVLKTSSPAMEDATPVLGVRTRSRASRGNSWLGDGGRGAFPLWSGPCHGVTDGCVQEVSAKDHHTPRTARADVATCLHSHLCDSL